MGNRAVITTRKNFKNNGIGVYLHWNGGRDSVEAFLKYCELKQYRNPSQDCYGLARLCQVIGNFFGGSTSVGIDTLEHLDLNNGDNGVYIIENWNIIDRRFYSGQEQDDYPIEDMLVKIDECMPNNEQLGKEFLSATEYDVETLEIGDNVFYQGYGDTRPTKCTIIAKVKDDQTGRVLPMIDYYRYFDEDQIKNSNNVLRGEKYRAIKINSGKVSDDGKRGTMCL